MIANQPLFVMQLEDVVPWGRSFDEYRAMFALSEDDLDGDILGCADGPASFNAEATECGHSVISCDPLYQFEADDIRRRVEAVAPDILAQVEQEKEQYLWESIGSVEELERVRKEAMSTFLADYDDGREQGRYVAASLPSLPFSEGQFDLALCSHYLFLYSEHVDEAMHRASLRELCRVAAEVRVFPVVSLQGNTSTHLASVLAALSDDGIEGTLEPVRYRFQKGATEMLVASPG